MNQRPEVGLLLDEMFSPAIAAELRKLGHDVIAVADRPDLRSKSVEEIFAWASTQQRWLLTENVKDFRPIMLRALQAGPLGCGLLFTSSRAFPRSRKNSGSVIKVLDGHKFNDMFAHSGEFRAADHMVVHDLPT